MLEEYQYGEGSIMSYLEFVLRTCTFASIINLLFTSRHVQIDIGVWRPQKPVVVIYLLRGSELSS